jgi:lysophospholipase L1-like esterase
MSRKLIPLVAACALAGILPSTALAKHKKHPTRYYLALGDSLARGAQPFGPIQSNGLDQTIATNQGYANDLYAAEKHKLRGLRLKQLGCLGETTTTMMDGGICHYRAGNQLAQAVKFILKHKIAFITLDIGANDVDGCVTGGTNISIPCVTAGVATIQANVPKIVKALRKAAGRRAKIAGMTYYDPFLADWFTGASGLTLATLSQTLAKTVNGDLTTAFKAKRVRVADVATDFDTYGSLGTTPFPYGPEPTPVVNICKWTWMCASAPRGPNIHANAAGYTEIATVFKKTLG